MRLWTIHPRYLDAKGLVALWREGLLARNVLEGLTRGYRNHPQLQRFRTQSDPVRYLDAYLWHVLQESKSRGYRFDEKKVSPIDRALTPIEETDGQLIYEWHHLLRKLAVRDTDRYRRLSVLPLPLPEPGPLFHIVPGHVRDWEKSGVS